MHAQPTERDREMARELAADAHCRYCNWITDSSGYADVMKCKGDHADLLETITAALARARAEEREALRKANHEWPYLLGCEQCRDSLTDWLDAREKEE